MTYIDFSHWNEQMLKDMLNMRVACVPFDRPYKVGDVVITNGQPLALLREITRDEFVEAARLHACADWRDAWMCPPVDARFYEISTD